MTEALALVGGTVIDGTEGEPIRDAIVLIESGRITRVARAAEGPVPAEFRTIRTAGMTVMPGLMDLHVHLCAFPGHTSRTYPPTPETYLALWGAHQASLDLRAGFTTVRDAFAFHRETGSLSLRHAVENGLLEGPRIIPAGHAGMTGSISDMRLPPDIERPYGMLADGPWELRKRVRECLRDGYDWIKTFTSGGRRPGQQEEDVWYLNHTAEEISAIADEVHKFDAGLMIHATTREAIKLAVECGADTIEHGWPLDDELIELMIKKGTYLVPTISVYSERGFLKPGTEPHLLNRAQRQTEVRMKSFERAYKAGVKIATGSDIAPSLPTMRHGENAFELTMMVRHGMKPIDAIRSSTRIASEALRIDKEVGTLTAGKIADVLVVEGDPLADIEVIERQVAYVLKDGRLVVDNKGGVTETRGDAFRTGALTL